MKLTDNTCFAKYARLLPTDTHDLVKSFGKESNGFDLGYRIQASAVYSSNIEGNTLDLNSYMNLKIKNELTYKKKEISEIDDLVAAYNFAGQTKLNESNFLEAHRILSKNLLIKANRGNYRQQPISAYPSLCGRQWQSRPASRKMVLSRHAGQQLLESTVRETV